jgi:hypothetical protein
MAGNYAAPRGDPSHRPFELCKSPKAATPIERSKVIFELRLRRGDDERQANYFSSCHGGS